MTFLAFITYTVIGHHDVAFTTREPVECTSEALALGVEWFAQYGVEVWASCDYTAAPAMSIRPRARP